MIRETGSAARTAPAGFDRPAQSDRRATTAGDAHTEACNRWQARPVTGIVSGARQAWCKDVPDQQSCDESTEVPAPADAW